MTPAIAFALGMFFMSLLDSNNQEVTVQDSVVLVNINPVNPVIPPQQ